MAMLKMLTSLAAIAMLLGIAMATNYTVGGPNGGWNQFSDVQAWAASKTFFVGDNLIFSYALSHSVLEVTKASFESCQITAPLAIYTGGMTVITLASVGKRYFICGTGGHCNVGGMKLEINTLPKASPPPPAKAATPPTATPKAPPPSTPTTPSSPPPSTPKTSPASAPSTAPVASPPSSSPSPKSSSAPSPKYTHKISPARSPSKSSHSHSPVMPPTGVPTSPSVEAPGLPPSIESPGLPPSDASAPAPSAPSSADKISVVAGSTVGFGFVVMMFLL